METQGLASHQKKASRLNATIVFIDEAGFFLHPTVRRTWAPAGKTPVLKHRTRHHRHISTIGAITVSPKRRRLGLYLLFLPGESIRQNHILCFLRALRRHFRTPVIVVWDHLGAHLGKDVRNYVAKTWDFHVEHFPSYAPELNPVEYCWSWFKCNPLGNYCPENIDELQNKLLNEYTPVRNQQSLLQGFIRASELQIRLPKLE